MEGFYLIYFTRMRKTMERQVIAVQDDDDDDLDFTDEDDDDNVDDSSE